MDFMPYLMTWYPNTETYFQTVDMLVAQWITRIEAGIPFSDPAADGPTLTVVNHEMTQQGASLTSSLELLDIVMKRHSHLRICMMSYLNPILQYWIDSFFEKAQAIWIDSFLIPDLPAHEYGMVRKKSIAQTSIISPNLPDEDIIRIAQQTDGFLYVLSFIWTTGTGKDFKASLAEFITRIRACVGVEKELVVWFGIKTPDDVAFLNTLAIDGYIVGSQITREIQQWGVKWLEKYIKTML